jgi:hypothetical protein
VEQNFDVLRDKHSNSVTNLEKARIWKNVTSKINALGVAPRSVKEIKNKWRNWTSIFGAGPPPVIFVSLLFSVKADLAFDVKFLHLFFISFTLLGATPKALILLVTFFHILAFSRFVTELECLSLNTSKYGKMLLVKLMLWVLHPEV